MSSLMIDLIVCGLAYVIIVYLITVITKNSLNKKKGGDNDEGGIRNFPSPKIDLPPGVVWPSDAPKRPVKPEPVEA